MNAATDELDRRLVLATQSGLPLVPQPYHALAGQLGVPVEQVLTRLSSMLEGGIIRDMLVREGDLVQAGQTLVRLDDTPAKSKLRRLVLREYRLLTMQARLEAQIDLKEDFVLPAALAASAKDPEVAQIFARQKMELKARRQNQADEEQVLRKEVAALKESIGGYEAQTKSVEQRLTLFTEERFLVL